MKLSPVNLLLLVNFPCWYCSFLRWQTHCVLVLLRLCLAPTPDSMKPSGTFSPSKQNRALIPSALAIFHDKVRGQAFSLPRIPPAGTRFLFKDENPCPEVCLWQWGFCKSVHHASTAMIYALQSNTCMHTHICTNPLTRTKIRMHTPTYPNLVNKMKYKAEDIHLKFSKTLDCRV